MERFILGKKLEMTQIFTDQGVVPVTVIQAGPCKITAVKDLKVQIGFETTDKLNKPEAGHQKKSESSFRHLAEFAVTKGDEQVIGHSITVADFQAVKKVQVVGTSKGKGFSGVIKRHNHHRGPETHGSDHHRRPGSVGSMFPQHTLKGRKLPGQMGAAQITVKNLKVIATDHAANLIVLKGAVPGASGTLLKISGVSE